MMVAAISEAASADRPNPKASSLPEGLQTHRRPPLLDNGVGPRRPKSREVPSRYMSPSPSNSTSSSSSSSRRYPSPLVSRAANMGTASTPLPASAPSVPKRSLSVDRRRPVASRSTTLLPEPRLGNAVEVSAATKLLFTSTRSLSVSFQGEAFSLPISKTKAPPPPNLSRKGTPERRRTTPLRGKVDGGGGDQVENSKPIDHRWPGRTRQANPLSRSLDCRGDKSNKLFGSGTVVQALKQSMIDDSRRVSFDGGLSLNLGNSELWRGVQRASDVNSVPSDLTASDSDSVSSGSTSGVQECNGVARGKGAPRGIVVSARFWQETNTRLRRLQDPSSPFSTSPASRMAAPPKFMPSKRFSSDCALASPRTMSSPVRGVSRPASPSKLAASLTLSPSRGFPSPSRVRNSVNGALSSNSSSTPSILSFSVDVRRGKMGENRIVDAHLLRLLYNRHLQWRFVNARAEAATFMQKLSTEKSLWNASITVSDLRKSVRGKRIELQLLRQRLKLTSILKGQRTYLEEWALLDREHSISLIGAIEALKASTLRLPVVGGAVADIQSMKDAVGSAVDVMQAMATSICSFLSKVEEINSLLSELANMTTKERGLLEQGKDFLSTLAAMQVKESSLRTHIIQVNRVPTTS